MFRCLTNPKFGDVDVVILTHSCILRSLGPNKLIDEPEMFNGFHSIVCWIVTSASLLVTSALLVVTMFAIRNKKLNQYIVSCYY